MGGQSLPQGTSSGAGAGAGDESLSQGNATGQGLALSPLGNAG